MEVGRSADGSALLTRRNLLSGAAAVGLSGALAPRSLAALSQARTTAKPIGLPSPNQVRADFQRMVDFGPRLTASDSHNRYVAWLEQQFTQAGLQVLPCDTYSTERWLAQKVGLEILDGSGAGPVKVATYYPRSQETAPEGITGPLVYGGVVPVPSLSGTDVAALGPALARYPGELESWAEGISGTLAGLTPGSLLVVDLPVPVPLTLAAFLAISTYRYWPGHSDLDWANSDYKRVWIMPGLGIPLAPFQALGAKGVVFVVDASFQALEGGYLPFTHGFEPLPALYVDRDTGAKLRALAAGRPKARMTLSATRTKEPAQSVTAILPGQSNETLIFNTHTDGQGFVEENAGVAFVHLARHFASLPKAQRLKRTLVFAAWPGHMVADLPQAQGWIDSHADLVKRAAAALTVEHLGCSEWNDTIDKGYHATGQPEMFAVWTTQGKMFELVRDTVTAHGLARTMLLRGPVQFGVGGAFASAGVPQIGAIGGPEYLLNVSKSGDMDKLDEALAARQIAWIADLATRIDGVPADSLRSNDPTAAAPNPLGLVGTAAAPSQKQQCAFTASTAPAVHLRYYGRRRHEHGVVVALSASGGSFARLVVELRRNGQVIAQATGRHVSTSPKRLVLRRTHGRRVAAGNYSLVVRNGNKVIARRHVHVGS